MAMERPDITGYLYGADEEDTEERCVSRNLSLQPVHMHMSSFAAAVFQVVGMLE
jgi:hypothetical protein